MLDLLVEGVTDERAVVVLVEGLARLYAPATVPIVWGKKIRARCAEIRHEAGELLRAAGSRRFVILTDAWCDPAAVVEAKRPGRRARAQATTDPQQIAANLAAQVTGAGRRGAIGVACAELETWFLLSTTALHAAGYGGGRVPMQDPRNDCAADRVVIEDVGKVKLEQILANYSAAVAARMASAIVETAYSCAALMRGSRSFCLFVADVVRLLGGNPPQPCP